MDPTKDPAESPEQLVADAIRLKREIAQKAEQLGAIEQKIIALGAGKYAAHDGQTVNVVGASEAKPGTVYYTLEADAVDQAKKLAGDEFKSLFTRTEVFTPCEGFALVVPRVLTPAKARDLEALCRKVGAGSNGRRAYILYPK